MGNIMKHIAGILSRPILQKKTTTILVIANLCVLSLYVTGWSSNKPRPLLPQGSKRAIIKENILKNEPVEITDVTVKGESVALGEKFEGEADWLMAAGFKLKNKTNKVITFIVLDIDFPETQDTGSIIMHSLFLGQHPDAKSTRPSLYLRPNESIDISLAPQFVSIKKAIELRRSSIDDIHKIVVRLDQVIFEDGTLYSGGSIFKRNPDLNSPRKWVPRSDTPATPQN